MNRLRVVLTILMTVLLFTPACTGRGGPVVPPEPAASVESTSSLGTLVVALDSTVLRTVDRLSVTITLSRAQAVIAGELSFVPEDHGWTTVRISPAVTSIDDDGHATTRWVFVLEPFLEGSYEVPIAAIDLRRPGIDSVNLSSTEMTVEVRSVFVEGEEMSLADPLPIERPPPPADHRPIAFISAILGVVVLIGVAVIATIRLRAPPIESAPHSAPPTGRERIGSLRHDLMIHLSQRHGLNAQNKTVDELEMLLDSFARKQNTQTLALLREMDVLLYGPDEPTTGTIEAIDRRVSQLLSPSDDASPTTGGRS